MLMVLQHGGVEIHCDKSANGFERLARALNQILESNLHIGGTSCALTPSGENCLLPAARERRDIVGRAKPGLLPGHAGIAAIADKMNEACLGQKTRYRLDVVHVEWGLVPPARLAHAGGI